jgi:hypothetical protein
VLGKPKTRLNRQFEGPPAADDTDEWVVVVVLTSWLS